MLRFLSLKSKLALACIFAICVIATFYYFGPPGLYAYQLTSLSPDGRSKADVYAKSLNFFASPGQGGAGSRQAVIVLRNEWGFRVGSSLKCNLLIDDVKIQWGLGNQAREVQVARAKFIDLDKGNCVQ
jgi:hypothetical protein